MSAEQSSAAKATPSSAPAHAEGWASPAPAGLVALAIACFCFYAILSGKANGTAAPLLGCWLIGGFIVQISVALIELRGGHLTGGNVFLFFSAFFMLTGGLEFLLKGLVPYFAPAGTKIASTLDGYAWLVLFITLVLWTPAYLKQSPLFLSLVVLALDVGVFFVTFMDLGVLGHDYAIYAAYFILAGGIFGIYVSSAIILNAAFGKTILPMPGPILK